MDGQGERKGRSEAAVLWAQLKIHGVESVDVAGSVVKVRIIRKCVGTAVGQSEKRTAPGISDGGTESAEQACRRAILQCVVKPRKVGENTSTGPIERADRKQRELSLGAENK